MRIVAGWYRTYINWIYSMLILSINLPGGKINSTNDECCQLLFTKKKFKGRKIAWLALAFDFPRRSQRNVAQRRKEREERKNGEKQNRNGVKGRTHRHETCRTGYRVKRIACIAIEVWALVLTWNGTLDTKHYDYKHKTCQINTWNGYYFWHQLKLTTIACCSV